MFTTVSESLMRNLMKMENVSSIFGFVNETSACNPTKILYDIVVAKYSLLYTVYSSVHLVNPGTGIYSQSLRIYAGTRVDSLIIFFLFSIHIGVYD